MRAPAQNGYRIIMLSPLLSFSLCTSCELTLSQYETDTLKSTNSSPKSDPVPNPFAVSLFCVNHKARTVRLVAFLFLVACRGLRQISSHAELKSAWSQTQQSSLYHSLSLISSAGCGLRRFIWVDKDMYWNCFDSWRFLRGLTLLRRRERNICKMSIVFLAGVFGRFLLRLCTTIIWILLQMSFRE